MRRYKWLRFLQFIVSRHLCACVNSSRGGVGLRGVRDRRDGGEESAEQREGRPRHCARGGEVVRTAARQILGPG